MKFTELVSEPTDVKKPKVIKNENTDASLDDLLGEEVKETLKGHAEDDISYQGVKEEIENSKSVWLRFGGKGVNDKLVKMGDSKEQILKFQKTRLIRALTLFLVTALLGIYLMNIGVLVVAVFGGALFIFIDLIRVNNRYKEFQFKRQLDFNKLLRQLMPYLKSNNVVLYKALEKMKDRIGTGTTRTSLVTLIAKMNSNPGSRLPYEEFAESASGLEESVLIMQTIYDYQRSSNDSTTISNLASLVDRAMERSVDEIIEKKDFRFYIEPYLIVSCFMIIAFGYFIAMVVDFSGSINL